MSKSSESLPVLSLRQQQALRRFRGAYGRLVLLGCQAHRHGSVSLEMVTEAVRGECCDDRVPELVQIAGHVDGGFPWLWWHEVVS